MKKKFFNFLLGIFILISVLIVLIPIFLTISNSFMSEKEILNRYTKAITPYNWFDSKNGDLHYSGMSLLPSVVTLDSYKTLFFKTPLYLRLFWNSILIVAPIVLGQCLFSPLAAYAFERMQSKRKEILYYIYIFIMLLPIQILLVPQFLLFGWIGITNSYLNIILPALFRPFGVFICRQQLKSFPKECFEAAEIEGAGEFTIFSKIVLPNLKSTIAGLSILTFVEYWNVIEPVIAFIKSSYKEPLSVYLYRIIENDIGMFFAVSCFYLIPAILVFLWGQEHLTEGISLSISK